MPPPPFQRILLIVLDGAGIGAMPDAAAWGDAGSDTFGHILESRDLQLPNLQRYGLGNIRPLKSLPPLAEPNGFPATIIDRFVTESSVPGILGNIPASGTEIIKVLGEEHVKTRKPIVYTSADSVFQIAAHEEVIPLPRLYEMCETARRILDGEHRVGRVIARPFMGQVGAFYRTENRHDYAVPPPRDNLLPALSDEDLDVVCIGKIASIYDSMGVTKDLVAKNNEQSIDQTIASLRAASRGLIFSNLVDFDMLYGHRRDTEGYAKALEHFDARLPEIEQEMRVDDVMMITADHGNDPTFPGSDHTREYAPLLVYGKNAKEGVDLGTRASLADIGQTVAENFGLKLTAGESFLRSISKDKALSTKH